jgi:RIO-like serine/threonine protein kinase
MPVDWTQYTLAELKQHRTLVFRQGGGSRPDVFLIEINGERAVLKDQNGADRVFSLIIGPLLNWRETAALRKLSTCHAIPNLLAVPNKRAFLMTYHESRQITKLADQSVDWPSFFGLLEARINEIHKLGVAHNDLRNPTNTLVTPQGEPILVDLVAYFSRGAQWNLVKNWLFEKFCQVDLSAITKLKTRFAPELVQQYDIHPEAIAGRSGMAARSFGQWVRKISKSLLTNNKE